MKKNITTIITIASTLMLASCDNNGGDDTIANWFLAIFGLLAWLKGGK